MEAKDLLADGELIVNSGGTLHLTDRKLIIMHQRRFTAIPYAQISSFEYEKGSTIWGLVALGLFLMALGTYVEVTNTTLFSTKPFITFLILVVFGIFCTAIGLLLPSTDFTIRTTSGGAYSLRTRDTKLLQDIVRRSSRPFRETSQSGSG